jgi:spore germination cell wall hydrolase CwlJ-like protein
MPLTIEYRPIVLPAELRGPSGTPVDEAPSTRHVRSGSIAAGIAIAAFAAFGFDANLEADAAVAAPSSLQPFEQAGANFPGSAFYYLDRDSGVVEPKARASDAERPAANLGAAIARPTFFAGTAEDRFRALHCLTAAIYYEAATEPDAGQRAVAQVVLNRVAHPQWPNSVCGVVYQGSERPGCQFSFACDGSMARAPVRMWWLRARAVAERALAGEVYAPVGLATYYHTGAVHPIWADRMTFVGAIGAHLFYRPPGGDGTATAFTDRYWGGEPTPAPRPRIAPVLSADPLRDAAEILGRSQAILPRAAPTAAKQAPPSVADSLPAASQVRPEYRNSGRWIASPGG